MNREAQPTDGDDLDDSTLPEQVVGLGVVIAVALGIVLWRGGPEVDDAAIKIGGAALVACFPLWGIVRQLSRQKTAELRQHALQTRIAADTWRRQEVADAYRACAKVFLEIGDAGRGGGARSGAKVEAIVQRFFLDHAPLIMVMGSEEIVRALSRWREAGQIEHRESGLFLMAAWADVLLALRRDANPQGGDVTAVEVFQIGITSDRAELSAMLDRGRELLDELVPQKT